MITLDFEKPIEDLQKKIDELKALQKKENVDFGSEIHNLESKCESVTKEIYRNLQPWQVTKVARHPNRPLFPDYIQGIFTNFNEFHGDRNFRDDRALIGGFAKLDGKTVMLIGEQKGKNTKENLDRNFGMPRPEGYRKALRLMKLAEKFKKPVITFIDTPGAYPGIDAEERGQSEAIATNIYEMSGLEVPIIVVITGEGGSGGALAIGVGDRVLMLSNSIYSVISPEGCASILWSDATKAETAAENLKITATDLHKIGIIDTIIEEPVGGAHRDYPFIIESVKDHLIKEIKSLSKLSVKKLTEQRYNKFMKMGIFTED